MRRYWFLLCFALISGIAFGGGYSLRFNGNGTGDIDRVKIQIDPQVPADIGATNFTIEFWMKANPGENTATGCTPGNDNWVTGNVILDRDVFGNGDHGDYGISVMDGGIAFGVNNGSTGNGVCGTMSVADGNWHHVAITRRLSDGRIQLYVDGILDKELATGPTGDLSYNDGRPNGGHTNDPFLVVGAEKFDTGSAFHGWVDEIRLSTNLRYTSSFTRPAAAFVSDANTAALYHFDEGGGNVINDSSSGGASDGVRNFGGSPAGPEWSADKAPIGPITLTFPTLTTASSPVAVTNAHDGSNRLFITQRGGQIIMWNGSANSTFMDIDARVQSGGERGLLSVAFHPDYPTTPFFYVYYTNNNGDIVISRFTILDANHGDPNSELILITIPHPVNDNHNGGQLQFGPDGYLYAATGDGGSANDPPNNAQNINVLLGKMLRFDVDAAAPYIPPTNPYVGIPGADEIWDIGLRNPWRYSFDRVTGDLIIGDVGQGAWEEVDFEPAGGPGAVNYGWKIMEGNICRPPTTGCDMTGLTLPVLVYDHNSGDCAIAGGYRYRGTLYPQLYGTYFYGDNCTGNLWRGVQGGAGSWTAGSPQHTTFGISAFGEDEAGEMYVVDLFGTIARIVGTNSNISVTMTDTPDPTMDGNPLTYNIVVTNNGPNAATGVQFVDTLPADTTFVSSSSGSCTHNSGIVTCNIGALANGANSTFNIVVTPNVAETITNVGVASANENDQNTANNIDSEDTVVNPHVPSADLAVTQTDNPDPVLFGTNVAYTVTVNNNGPDNDTGVTLTDTLPGQTTFVSAPGCNEAAGVVTCAVGALNNGANAQFVITVTTDAVGTITNAVAVSGDLNDPTTGNNTDSEDTTVNPPQADLSATQTDSPDPVVVGNNVVYTVTVTNGGPQDDTNVTLTDTLPAGVTFVSAPGCTESAGTLTCAIGNLANGANQQFVITITTTAIGQITNNASVSGDQSDPNPNNNADAETTQVTDACLFCDDFEDGTLSDQWTYTNGTWTETGGVLSGTFKKKSSAVATPVFAGCSVCSVEAHLQGGPGAGSKVWLLAWYVDKNNTVELQMKQGSDQWILKQRINKKVKAKVKFKQTILPDVFYDVLLNYDGTNFTVQIDGVPAITMPAIGSVSGTVGFQVKHIGALGDISVN